MIDSTVFHDTSLTNRLGQALTLPTAVVRAQGRELVFVATPANVPNFLVKNGETIAFQLRQLFGLDERKFELLEVKTSGADLVRWRFEWVGSSPIAQQPEPVSAASQQQFLWGLLGNTPTRAIA